MEEPTTIYNLAEDVNAPGPDDKKGSRNCEGCSCLKIVSDGIIKAVSRFFYKLGYAIGGYPWVAVVLCLVCVAAFIPGIGLYFYQETAGENLWVPHDSPAKADKAWVDKHFPTTVRFGEIIVEDENVLSPETLQALLELHLNITGSTDPTWESVCTKNGPNCLTNSLLELWSFDTSVISGLSQDDILTAVNTITTSPVFQIPLLVESMLGAISRDGNGRIIGAGATTITYVIKANGSIPREDNTEAIAFEAHLTKVAKVGHSGINQVTYYTTSTTSDDVSGSIFGDVYLLVGGYVIIFTFVAFVLGRFNCVQQRVYVSLSGILCVGLSIIVSYGLCSYARIPYGPLHSILPFLLIGIGVDDMFVIIQALDQVIENDAENELPIQERVAKAMEHAGVSITVTSVTDVVAFAIGAITVLPALRSFCLYASIGILAIFILQATFFVACVTIDERRARNVRNACCCCFMHQPEWRPNKCSQIGILQKVFDSMYAPIVVKLPVKIIVLILTLVLFCIGIWGLSSLKQESNFLWFLPPDSDSFKYFDTKAKLFPDDGRFTTAVYLGNFSYVDESVAMDTLHDAIVNEPYTDTSTVSNWWFSLRIWLKASNDISVTSMLDDNGVPLTDEHLATLMQMYMFTPPQAGIRFSRNVKFNEDTTRIVASQIPLVHIQMVSSVDRVPAMDGLRRTCGDAGLTHDMCFAYSRYYLNTEGDKAIQHELFRNIGLAFLCIVIMVLILLADVWACVFVSISVLLCLVDVGGIMYFWGLTIDTVTTIQLIIAIGLIVDYSAHVGHTFMVKRGTRDERTIATLGYIGPAVLFGGFSTFLAFILLAGSQSYVFKSFFKVLLSVVIFGLFHGLVFLPVVLSWLGPAPYFVENYTPSIIDKGIGKLKDCSCKPSEKSKERMNNFREKSKLRWQNMRSQTLPNVLPSRKKKKLDSNDNIIMMNGNKNHSHTRRDVTNSAYINRAFIPPPSAAYSDDPVIYLPMSDLLSVSFRMNPGQPPGYATQSSAKSMPNLGWERSFKRVPKNVGQPTAWAPAYKTGNVYQSPT